MKTLLFICLLLSLNPVSFEGLELQMPGKYSNEFTKLSESLSETKTLKANFIQNKKIKVLKRPLISSGQLIFDRKTGVFWKLEKPFESTIVIDDKKLTAVDDDGKKTVIKASEKPMLYGFTKIFLSIFSGDTKTLKEHFDIYYKGGGEEWQIGLTPRSSELKKVLSQILLSGKNKTVTSIKLRETNGDITDITFSNTVIADQLSAEDKKKFEF